LLETGTSSVLINGVPGINFKCRRGVRQGDPLSPLLFVLGAELLQYVINDLKDRGLLKLPILVNQTDFPIVQYADDTILVLEADQDRLAVLKQALHDLSLSTGPVVNYHKSCMLPINIIDQKVHDLAEGFGCSVGTFPFTYLGLPMGTTRPKIVDLMPLVDRLERRLTASSSFLAYGGRLQLTASCLSSMPIFFLSSLDVPLGIVEQVNRIIRQCLWRKRDGQSSGQSLAAWDMICRPKKSGGLGLIDFKKLNEGLLMKHLHKFYNKEDIPWVHLVWQHYSLCMVTVGFGDTALFWSDSWQGEVMHNRFPRLYSFALDTDVSVQDVMSRDDKAILFELPLSEQAFQEYQDMLHTLSQIEYSPKFKISGVPYGKMVFLPQSFTISIASRMSRPV
jgi:hypothetical protein